VHRFITDTSHLWLSEYAARSLIITYCYVGLFLLAIDIVNSKNETNKSWFLQHLRNVVSNDRMLTFVSDRYVGCTGSKYSGKPVLLSSELRLCPITCEPIRVSYPAVCGRKNPPTIKLAHTLEGI